LWQKIKLIDNYKQALEQIDNHLEFWPEFLIHKNKQRFTKIIFYLMKRRKLRLTPQEKLVPIK
jgi:protein MAK16